MRNILALLILSFFMQGLSKAQTSEQLKEYFDEGQYFFIRGDYQDALFYYLKLIAADSLNANYNFKVGEAYLNIPGKEHFAVPYFERAVEDIVPKKEYHKRAFEEDSAPLHAWFYLGNAYRMDNQLDKALEAYATFTDNPHFHYNYNLGVVEREIKSCERAKIIKDAPVEFEKINLGSSINSEFSEEKPVISADGSTLVFIRRLKFYDAIFWSVKQNGKWSQAVNINPQLLSDGDYYPSGLSSNGKTLLLVREIAGSYDLYMSEFEGETWSRAEKLSGKVNTVSDEVHASFGADDRSLLITSNRRGGKGGFDIWISEKGADGSWKSPKNPGKQINTDADEQVAYSCNNGNVLFFSSQAHYTMGGFDIFYARKTGKKWHIPVNIGYPVNTTRDNLYYAPAGDNCRLGYYSLEEDKGYGGSDIYLIRLTSDHVLNFSEDKPEK